VQPQHHAALHTKPSSHTKGAAPLWIAGGHRTSAAIVVRPAAHAVKHAAIKHAVRPQRTKPAAAHRKLTAALSINLCAKAGSMTMPDATTVSIWGFALLGSAPSCNDASVVAKLPGPQIDVTAGDTITLNVTNTFSDRTLTIEAPGVNITGTQDVPPLATASLTFSAPEGTYLYESSGNAGRQYAMGLYGAFVVHSATAGQADGVPINAEKVLVLSEVDTAFAAGPDTFNLDNWHPSYWLINGKAYPDTPSLTVTPGERLLLRWVNAGNDNHTMSLLSLHQQLLARDGFALRAPYSVVSETFPSGQTADGLVTIPAAAAPGSKFPVYNRNLNLGMTMFLAVS
jgi:FtsP/CotA-like multicopper oxidase with cupredoxin domain